jgi:hypothetical protein
MVVVVGRNLKLFELLTYFLLDPNLQFSWGPLLKDLSRIDDNGLEKSNR